MSFRFKLAAWFALCFVLLLGALLLATHWHLDEELRQDRWDRSHPRFPGWVIHGSYTDEEVHDVLGELLKVWLAVGVPLAVAAAAAGYVMARRSLRPVRRINRELAALDLQTLERGITPPERDAELQRLVTHLNDLLARLDGSYRELADFTTRVAHELRTPLAVLRLRLESAAGSLPPEFSEEMQEELHRLTQLVERSLLAARAERGRLEVQPRSVDLSDLFGSLREDYQLAAEVQGRRSEWRLDPDLHGLTDPEILRQILHNLLSNALRHGASPVRVTARASGRRLVCRITNRLPARRGQDPGVGIGLRLVQGLVGSLPETTFRRRTTPGLFSIRLTLPAAA